MDQYQKFLENKIVAAETYGFKTKETIGNLLPHAQEITKWTLMYWFRLWVGKGK